MLFDPLHTITWFLLVKSPNRPHFLQQIMLPNLDLRWIDTLYTKFLTAQNTVFLFLTI
jgi:hypothetical protein